MIPMDMHLHTKYSDGKNTMEEMVLEAIKLGIKKIAFTDHVWKSSPWIETYLSEIKSLRKKYKGRIEIISGVEAKVIDLEGNIDFDSNYRKKIDYILASYHRIPLGNNLYIGRKEIKENPEIALKKWEQSIIRVLMNENVNGIAHLDAVFKRSGIEVPISIMKRVLDIAKKNNKIIEYNIKYDVPNSEVLDYIKSNDILLSIGSDSHSVEELEAFNKIKSRRILK